MEHISLLRGSGKKMLVPFPCFLHFPVGTRREVEDEDWLRAERARERDQCWGKWPQGPGLGERTGTRLVASSCQGSSIKVMPDVTASVSPEMCFGCSVVD